MARISLDPPATLGYRIVKLLSHRRYGVMAEPGAAIGHNMQVTRSYALFELQVERWRKLDHALKDLAVMAAAATVGCAWCMDFGYWEATMNHGVPAAKIRAVPGWRDSELFTDLERLVLEYAEAMSATPPSVTDELVEQISRHLSEAELIELTAIIAVENLRSRMNSALGLTSQGFKDRCDLQPVDSKAVAAEPSGR
ncbi:MAG TPA: carboxymuconolactone decarboxylase family protein [Streptosporangiaceae bacterium]